jgi:threonine/homoserine/homoserine lactone efflux protein
MNSLTLTTFALVAFIGIVTPGPTVLLAMSNGSRHGPARAGFGMAGAVVSDLILLGAVALGLGALLAASEFWFSVVKWLGVAYLGCLGVMLLRSNGTVDAPAAGEAVEAGSGGAGTPRALFLKSLLVAITNPKGYLFFSAFLPQFIEPTAPQTPQYLALGMTFVLIDCVVMLGYALLGSMAARFLKASGALWLDRVCGSALLALAGSLALYRRTEH